jgi:hypothetical protein
MLKETWGTQKKKNKKEILLHQKLQLKVTIVLVSQVCITVSMSMLNSVSYDVLSKFEKSSEMLNNKIQ